MKKMFRFSILVMITLTLLVACGKSTERPKEVADLVLKNGKIVTMDEAKPETQAVAVKGDRILALGSDEEINAYINPSTEVIDVGGKLVIPGFNESHGHFSSLGYAKMRLDLTKANSWDDIIAMVAETVKTVKPGQWILGRGWHQEKWDKVPEPNVDGLPLHDELSKVSPDNPVYFRHASGHAAFANAKAMELAGVDDNTPDPEGGEIVKTKEGRPIGVFRETASSLISNAYNKNRPAEGSEEDNAEHARAIELSVKTCLENGVTSFTDAGSSFDTIDLFKKLIQEKKITVRLNVMLGVSNKQLKERIAAYETGNFGNYHLRVAAIKRLIDGALGSHGAWLLEPYKSLPTSTGLNTEPIADMKEVAEIALDNGFQLCTHAIGDRGNRETLDIYEEIFKKHPDKKDLRWRIEHAQHIHPDDIPRFGKLGVIAAMQGIHCTSDAPWVFKRLGEKRAEEGAYVWQKLMNTGAVICNGTDVPVEDISPIACFYATVSRKTKDGSVFFEKQRMTREQALRSYTLNGAYASFEENIKGSITPGKLADITVLSQDIMTVPEDDIPKTVALYTIVGGKVLYKK